MDENGALELPVFNLTEAYKYTKVRLEIILSECKHVGIQENVPELTPSEVVE